MNGKDAAKLAAEWGGRPCKHQRYVKEDPGPYGQWSGDYVCTECGYMGPRREFEGAADKAPPTES